MANTTVYLAPIGNGFQFLTVGGLPLNAGQLNTYAAGTTTPQATYTTSSGSVANANPIVLGTDGRPPSEIWLSAGIAYKFVLADSTGALIPNASYDNLFGIGDPATPNGYGGIQPTTQSSAYTTIAADQNRPIEVTGTTTISLMTAGSAPTGYNVPIINTGTALVTVTVITGTDTVNGVAGGTITLPPWTGTTFALNKAATGYEMLYATGPYRQGVNVASAATVNLDVNGDGDYLHITGVTTITAITLQKGSQRSVVFDGILTFTNGASLVLPGAANITTAAGDIAVLRGEASGVVRCLSYFKAASLYATLAGTETLTNKTLDTATIAATQAITDNSTKIATTAFVKGLFTPITNSLGADVLLNNTANYFDGPSVAQGTSGTWFVSGTVTMIDSTASNNSFFVKLWDGTTLISSAAYIGVGSNARGSVSLSGYITSPAGNLRISVRDVSTTAGKMEFNASANSKDCTITAIRIG